MKSKNPLVVVALLLSVTTLFLEQVSRAIDLSALRVVPAYAGYAVLGLVVAEIVTDILRAPYKRIYLKQSVGALSFAAVFAGLFVYTRLFASDSVGGAIGALPIVVVVIRNVFILLRVFSRLRHVASFLDEISARPAQTIVVSFLVVILAGTLLLMLPFTHSEGRGLSPVDALFTATSAVCVTGLIVVDTATAFTVYGKIVILVLIQIGGLGIMLLSFFTVFVFRRSVSIRDKMLMSYMLSERDMTKLSRNLKTIIYTTLTIEAAGAVVLAAGIRANTGAGAAQTAFQAVFHAVSAFSNAGFSLYSDSLESFRGRPGVIVPTALLILVGGMGFAVIADLRTVAASYVRRMRDRLRRSRRHRLVAPSLNSVAVLSVSGALLLLATLAFYGLEYRNVLSAERVGGQYLSAFFQSVTLRTAGFNSVPFDALLPATYIAMTVFMFIGGASGSTAGGIKVNTVAVMIAYLISTIKDRDSVVFHRYSIRADIVARAFLILLFGISVVTAGTILLTLFESAPVEHLFFEAVSAFGTVGLSAGVTPQLSIPGRIVIIILMFFGRIGPLTILAAATVGRRKVRIEYPRGEIAIG